MKEINIQPLEILLEPEGRNTTPANTVAALKVLDILDKNAVHYDELGTINKNMLFLNEKTKVTIDELKGFNTKWLKEYMSN